MDLTVLPYKCKIQEHYSGGCQLETIFLNKYLEKLYKEAKKNRKYPLSQHLIDKYIEVIDFIKAADTIAAIRSRRSYKFEKLVRYDSRYSIRLNKKYRLEIEIEWTDNKHTIGIFRINEISKHYE